MFTDIHLKNTSLLRNFSAQIYSQLVTFGVQLGSVPLLIWSWGIDTYGVWILLSALPTYLAFSDFGFTFVAKNDMSMRVSRGDRAGALVSFQSIYALLLSLFLVLLIVILAIVCFAPIGHWLNTGNQSTETVQIVLVSQLTSALLYQFCLLMYAGVRCEGRAATETYFVATWRLLDACSIILVALSGGGLSGAASAGLAVRIVNLAVLFFWLKSTTPWLAVGFKHAQPMRIRQLALPSFSFMLVPISNALLIQGPIVLLGAIASPASVAVFSVTRTVCRLGTSVSNMVNYAFVPEYSFAFGKRNFERFDLYFKTHLAILIPGSILYLAVIYLFGPYGIAILSHRQVPFDTALAMVMATGVFAEMLWSAIFAALSAVNAHSKVALSMAILSAIAVMVSVVFLDTPVAYALAIAAVHIVLLVFVTLNLRVKYSDIFSHRNVKTLQ